MISLQQLMIKKNEQFHSFDLFNDHNTTDRYDDVT